MKRRKKIIHNCALRTKKKNKTETKKLSDYIKNIYKFTGPYERYYSLVIVCTLQTSTQLYVSTNGMKREIAVH